MTRERVVKYPPKRGIPKRSEVKGVVEKVIHIRRCDGETGQILQQKKEIVFLTSFRSKFIINHNRMRLGSDSDKAE